MTTTGAVSFGRRIEDLARTHPGETAILFAPTGGTEQAVSWRDLDRRSNRAARVLHERGVVQGSTVVVALRNSPEHLYFTIGAWRLGACVVPLRWDLPPWERDRLLGVAEPRAIVSEEPVPGARASVLGTDEIRAGTSKSDAPLPDRVPVPAHAIGSSGATGAPKLIVDPNPGLFDPTEVESVPSEMMGPRSDQVQLIPAPLYHLNGFMIAHSSLRRDQRIVLMERFEAAQVVDLVERHRVTTVTMVPTMLLRVARLSGIEHRDLSSLQSVLQGAASCPQWLVRAWIDLVGPEHFFVAYGSTERVGVTMLRGDEWLAHPGSVGRGLDTSVRIIGEDGKDLPPGEIGEIFLRREIDAARPTYEYRGAPAARTTKDGYTTIGDLGWLDADGYLYIADRRVDMIVSGGANVYPAEVEAALLECPEVSDAAVIGLPDEEWGQRVHAVVEPVDPERPPTAAVLDSQCRERLAAYKVPKSFELVTKLPRTEAGKLSRSALVAERRSLRR